MKIDHLSDLPEWDDIDNDDDDDVPPPSRTRIACKVLYNKWKEIVFILKGVLLPIAEGETEDQFLTDTATHVLQDALLIGARIRSSEAGDLYILRMGNAALIRERAQSIASSLLLFLEEDVVSEAYVRVIRAEIDKFRQLFILWASTFEKDDFRDEWGLFV